MQSSKISFQASNSSGNVSGILITPDNAEYLFVLGHGAGAPAQSQGMTNIAHSLANHNIATLRYNFPYIEKGAKSPGPPALAMATVRSAVQYAINLNLGLPILAGGKSYGGRMTSQAASKEPLPGIIGLVFYGFPLHAPGRDSIDRASHLQDINIPMLFLQGTRDSLAKTPLIAQVTDDLNLATLHIVEGGDHSFHMLKSAGISDEEVQKGLASKVLEWASDISIK